MLLSILARICGYTPGTLTWNGMDTHIYENHLDAINEQLSRSPKQLPELAFSEQFYESCTEYQNDVIENRQSDPQFLNKFIYGLEPDDFLLVGYDPHPSIKAEMSSGRARM